MENYLYFAENLVTTGGAGNTADTAMMVPASSFLGADPISTTTTALYFKDPARAEGDRIKVLLTHGLLAAGGGYKNVVKALSAAMNRNNPANGGFVVFADEEADNGTITGASTKTGGVQYDPNYDNCKPDSSTATAGGGSVQISNDTDSTTAVSGAGVTSTDYGLPQVRVFHKNGEIVTEVKFSLVGLHCSSTANDVIGLASGSAYLYQYVLATHGIIHRSELICQTVAAGGGTTDINVVYASSGTLVEDGAGGTTYGVNGAAVSTGGITVQEAAKTAVTTAHYAYATVGDTNGDASAFSAGHYIFRTYGLPALA